MTCQQIEDRIPAFVAGALSAVETAETSTHLERCSSCQSWLKEAADLFAMWQETGDATDFHVDLATPVMRRITPRQHDLNTGRQPDVTPQRIDVLVRLPSRVATEWRSSLYHYGLAATMALILFHFGVFEQIGPAATTLHALVVGKLQGWFAYASVVM